MWRHAALVVAGRSLRRQGGDSEVEMMNTARTGLYLIDSCKIFREGLKASLPEPEFFVWGESNSIDEALATLGKGGHSGIVLTEYPNVRCESIAKLGAVCRPANLK